jgi:DNA repair exonuclease SbcCD nuclease subunit
MRLLLVSDVHLDAPFTWARPDAARARRRALRETLLQACEVARSQQVDALLVAGDLYEQERFSPDTADFLRAAFADVGMRVYISPGNHDWYGAQSLYRQVEWTPNVHVFTEARLLPVELADGVTLWGAAHLAPAGTRGFLGDFAVGRGGVNLALFHGSETSDLGWEESGKSAHAPFTAEQIPQAGLAHAFVGHFHTPKDGAWHTYAGNPDPLTFGESGSRAAVLAVIGDDGSVERTRIPVSVSQVSDIDVDLTGVTNGTEVRARVEAAIAGLAGAVRVTLGGEIGRDADVRLTDLDGLGGHLDALVARVGNVRVAFDLDVLAGEQTVRGQFVRDVQAAALDDDTRRRVLVTGLRALDGRLQDLEVL